MSLIRLKRLIYNPKVTVGRIEAQSGVGAIIFHGYSLEEADLGNQREVSCIPVGTYSIQALMHSKHGKVWAVMNVPHRSGILIHKGNSDDDTRGCILVGMFFHRRVKQEDYVLVDSAIAMNFLNKALDWQEGKKGLLQISVAPNAKEVDGFIRSNYKSTAS